ncbi:hypothetical protein GCM10023307_35100 [Lysobacter hankyongensis]|uniref:Uncharacterized protein n=1 Tax=Lysobacter hankyongensis TaxID=1176535 RepID=A0ABP9CAX7_9GAMM
MAGLVGEEGRKAMREKEKARREPGLILESLSLRNDDGPDHPAGVWGSGRRAREVMPEAIRALDIDRGCGVVMRSACSHADPAGASG